MDSEPKTTHYVIFVSRVTHMHVTRMFSVQSHVSFLSPVSVFLLSQVFYIKIDDNSISIVTKLREGESVNEHIRAVTEIFEALAEFGDAVTEEDRVVHLLAESYNVLVTALEAQSENVPKWDVVTERLLHQKI